VKTTYTGIEQERPHGMMTEVPADIREKYLNSELGLPTYKVDKSSYEEKKGTIPVVKEYLHVIAPNYANVSGKRLFITPNLFDRSETRLPADSVRKYDYIDNEAFTHTDSIVIRIPAGYKLEAAPKEIHLDGPYGRYSTSVVVGSDKIVYFRRREQSMGRFPPSAYPELVKFYEQLYKSDHSRIVLVKE